MCCNLLYIYIYIIFQNTAKVLRCLGSRAFPGLGLLGFPPQSYLQNIDLRILSFPGLCKGSIVRASGTVTVDLEK